MKTLAYSCVCNVGAVLTKELCRIPMKATRTDNVELQSRMEMATCASGPVPTTMSEGMEIHQDFRVRGLLMDTLGRGGAYGTCIILGSVSKGATIL